MVQLNPVPVFGAKRKLVPFEGNFSPTFPYNGKRFSSSYELSNPLKTSRKCIHNSTVHNRAIYTRKNKTRLT